MSDLMMPASDLESQLFDAAAPKATLPESSATVVSTGSGSEELWHPPTVITTTSSGRISKPKRKAASALERRHSLPESLLSSVQGGDSSPVPEFLCHLFSMLREPEYSDLISWQVPSRDEPDHLGGGVRGIGKIVIHKPEYLQEHVLGRYYRHSKYASFQRQLNYFGFKKRLHNGKKGKLSPCSYIHEKLSADIGSLFTLKRRPPTKKRGSEDSGDDTTISSKKTSSSSSKRRRVSVEKKSKKNTTTASKKTGKKNQKLAIDSSSMFVQVEAEEHGPPSQTMLATTATNNYYPKHKNIRTASSASERKQVALARRNSRKSAPQAKLLELLSCTLPPSDILFNDDVDSVDDEGFPAWVTDDGQYHYHNVDSSLVDLAMLY